MAVSKDGLQYRFVIPGTRPATGDIVASTVALVNVAVWALLMHVIPRAPPPAGIAIVWAMVVPKLLTTVAAAETVGDAVIRL